ncbi:DUF4926 domain-containing protein [Spirosoma telluris]
MVLEEDCVYGVKLADFSQPTRQYPNQLLNEWVEPVVNKPQLYLVLIRRLRIFSYPQNMEKSLQLLDIVALLSELPDEKLSIGQVGTIVEELADNVYEVEFADSKGRTLTTCAVEAKDLLKLTHELAV